MNTQIMDLTETILHNEKEFILPIKKVWLKLSLLGEYEQLSYEEFSQMLYQDDRFEVFDDVESETEQLLGNNKDDLEELGYYFGPRVMLKSRKPTRKEIGYILMDKTEQIFKNLKKAWDLRSGDEEEEDQLLQALASTQKLMRKLESEFPDSANVIDGLGESS